MKFTSNSTRFIALLGLLTLSITQKAEAIELTAVGGLNYAAPSQRLNGMDLRQTGNATASFGGLVAVNLFESSFDFETGAIYLVQQSERDNVIPILVQRMKFVQIPFLIRYYLDPAIGIGVGGYYSTAIGNVETQQNGFTTETPYETLFYNKYDAGILASIRARFNVSENISFLLDARYQHGLVNMSRITNDFLNTRSIQMLAGLTYTFDMASEEKENTSRVRIVE